MYTHDIRLRENIDSREGKTVQSPFYHQNPRGKIYCVHTVTLKARCGATFWVRNTQRKQMEFKYETFLGMQLLSALGWWLTGMLVSSSHINPVTPFLHLFPRCFSLWLMVRRNRLVQMNRDDLGRSACSIILLHTACWSLGGAVSLFSKYWIMYGKKKKERKKKDCLSTVALQHSTFTWAYLEYKYETC